MPTLDILVVDDQTPVCETLARQLREAGGALALEVRVEVAHSGLEARDKWRLHQYDAILVDYHMPGGMNGVDFIQQLEDPFRQAYLAVMSGYDESELRGALSRLYDRGLQFAFLPKQAQVNIDAVSIHHFLRKVSAHRARRPLPEWIARPLDRLQRAPTNQGGLTALSNVFENTAWFTGIIYLSELRRGGHPMPSSFSWKRHLCMGDWEQLLESWRRSAAAQDRSPFSAPLDLLCQPDRFLGDLRRFRSAVRNPFIGHGELEEEAYYRKLTSDFSGPLERLRADLAGFGRTPLFVRDTMNFGRGDNLRYQGYAVMGPDRPPAMEYTTKQRLEQHVPYLLSASGEVQPLAPWLTWRFCEDCKTSRLFAVHGFRKMGGQKIGGRTMGNAVYKDGYNHSIEVEDINLDTCP